MTKKIQMFILYFLIIIFSAIIFMYTISKAALDSGISVLCIGEIFLLYGGVWIKRNADRKDKKELSDTLKILHERSEKRRINYNQINDKKRHISYIRHDMANHIQVIKAVMADSGTAAAKDNNINGSIIQEMSKVNELLQKTSQVKYCDNYMLDIAIDQKVKELEERNIIPDVNVRLRNMGNAECEEFCIIFWLLVDNVAQFLTHGGRIRIIIHNREVSCGSERIGIAYRIEGDTGSIRKRKLTRSVYMYVADRLMEKSGGTMVNTVQKGVSAEVGMCELKITE